MSSIERKYKFVKDTAEVYRVISGGWDASIYLNDRTGEVTVVTGYQDNWAYAWSPPGRGPYSLKEFLVKADASYIMDKFSYGSDKWLDHDATLKQIQAYAKKEFGEGNLSQDSLDEIEDEISENLEEEIHDTDVWAERFYRCRETMALFGDDYEMFPCVTTLKPSLMGFMKHIWPQFIELLEKELKEINSAEVAKLDSV